jgi:predicted methyltransferase
MLPEDTPDNLDFQVDDVNGRCEPRIFRGLAVKMTKIDHRFTFRSDRYDVVHSQMMAGGIHANRWRSYIRDIFRVLRPGGWCQMVEIYFNAQSDNGSLTAGKSQADGLP